MDIISRSSVLSLFFMSMFRVFFIASLFFCSVVNISQRGKGTFSYLCFVDYFRSY